MGEKKNSIIFLFSDVLGEATIYYANWDIL